MSFNRFIKRFIKNIFLKLIITYSLKHRDYQRKNSHIIQGPSSFLCLVSVEKGVLVELF
jgi:hypothetical protein